MNASRIVVRPLSTFWSLLAISAIVSAGGSAYVAYHLTATGLLWIEGAVLFPTGLLLAAIGAFHGVGHRIVIDREEIVEERRGRVLSRHRLDDLSHIDQGTAPTLVFSDGRKLRLALVRSPGPSCLSVAEEHLAQEIERRRFERQAERVAPARRKRATKRARQARAAPSKKQAKPSAPRRGKRKPTRGPTTVQLPLSFLTFANACQVCRQAEPTDWATLEADVSSTLEVLGEVERKITVSVPLCTRCAKRWRFRTGAQAIVQGTFLVAVVVCALGWANLDWQLPGWLWAGLLTSLAVNVVASHRSVERWLSFRGLGVCIDRYLGDASGRAVLRFQHACLADEARRVTLLTQEQELAGV